MWSLRLVVSVSVHPPVTLTVYGLVESILIDQDPVMLSALTFKQRKFPAVVMVARAPFVWLELWVAPGKAEKC